MNTFMDYMRKMEESLSVNWDKTIEFQNHIKEESQRILSELSKKERVVQLEKVVGGLEELIKSSFDKMSAACRELHKRTDYIQDSIEVFHSSAMKMREDCIGDLSRFEGLTPENIAAKGALKALDMVQEFKDSYEFMKKVRGLLDERGLDNFGDMPAFLSKSFLDRKLLDFNLPGRLVKALRGEGMKTIGDVFYSSRKKVGSLNNFGAGSLAKLDKLFKDNGLSWE